MNCNIRRYSQCLLALSSAILLFFVGYFAIRCQRINADIRLTKDVVWRIQGERDQAVGGNVAEALQYLQMFHVPSSWDTGFPKHLAEIISLERRRAVSDIIAHLRATTGRDYGEDPQKWLQADDLVK